MHYIIKITSYHRTNKSSEYRISHEQKLIPGNVTRLLTYEELTRW